MMSQVQSENKPRIKSYTNLLISSLIFSERRSLIDLYRLFNCASQTPWNCGFCSIFAFRVLTGSTLGSGLFWQKKIRFFQSKFERHTTTYTVATRCTYLSGIASTSMLVSKWVFRKSVYISSSVRFRYGCRPFTTRSSSSKSIISGTVLPTFREEQLITSKNKIITKKQKYRLFSFGLESIWLYLCTKSKRCGNMLNH